MNIPLPPPRKRPVRFKTIYADPPWPEIGGGKIRRGADKHYSLMSVQQIAAMAPQIQKISEENCHLYLWVTNNRLHDGLHILETWGFRYITIITWMKDRKGLGQYYRGKSEHCLFGVKGVLPYRVLENGKRAQGVTAFKAPRTKHSSKPNEMRQMIEIVSWPPRLELFAREKSRGWYVWGNEIECSINLPHPN